MHSTCILKKCYWGYENFIWNIQTKNAMFELKCELSSGGGHDKRKEKKRKAANFMLLSIEARSNLALYTHV